MSRPVRYRLCGVTLETDWPIVSPLLPAADEADLHFSVVSEAPRPGEWQLEAGIDGPRSIPYLEVGRIGTTEVVRVINVGDAWMIDEDEIVFHLLYPENDFQVEVVLLGVLLAFWLERRGTSALHGAAVAFDGWSIGILGPSGSGKTSLAFALVAQGARLVTDDLLAVSVDPEEAAAKPSFPQVRLWPEQARQLLGTTSGLEKAYPNYEKLRVPLLESQMAVGPTRLIGLYVRRQAGSGPPTIEPVAGPPALFHLIFNTFARELVDTPSSRPDRIRRLGKLLDRVPVFSLPHVEDGLALSEQASMVETHSRELVSQSNLSGRTASEGANGR